MSCFRKNSYWAGCKETCFPGRDPTDPPDARTPWSCELLQPDASPALGARGGAEADAVGPQFDRGVANGPLRVGGVGIPTYATGGGGRVQDPALLLGHLSGFSILRSWTTQYSPESFALFRLLAGKISFTVDLSRVGCACNVAFYLTGQPAKGADGYFNPGEKGDYYCDANDVQSQWCPEIDIMEANKHVFVATPHTCDEPTVYGHYTNCDRKGIGQSTMSIKGAYGPGSRYRINTEEPFTVTTEFESADGATLTGMRTTLAQQGRTVVLDHHNCDPAYLARLSGPMAEGMAIRISYWGKKPETMAWLDEPPCSATAACTGRHAGFAAISGIVVQGSLAPPVYQPMRPVEVPAPTIAPPLPPWPWVQQPTEPPEDPFAGNGFTWPEYEPQASPVAPTDGTDVPVAPLPMQAPSQGTAAFPAARGVKRRRSRFRPKVALAAATAAILGAFVIFGIFPPCKRGPGPLNVAMPSQGRLRVDGPHWGSQPPSLYNFNSANPGFGSGISNPIYSQAPSR